MANRSTKERTERNEQICQRYREGLTLRKISEQLNVPIGTVGDVVCKQGEANRRPKLNAHQKATIGQMVQGYTVSEIAEKARCSRSIAYKYIAWYRRREEQRIQDSGAAVPLNCPKVCPIHGKIVLWPCVACKAEESLANRLPTRERSC